MDPESKDVTDKISTGDETNLPDVMASLEILTIDTNAVTSVPPKRSLRKRSSKPVVVELPNRRCNQKPKKRKYSEIQTESDVRDYYLDKKLKCLANNLETIFEETEETPDNKIRIGVKKFRRMIEFRVEPTASKIKKRQARVKRMFGSSISNSLRRKRITMQALFEKLENIKSEPSPEFEAQVT